MDKTPGGENGMESSDSRFMTGSYVCPHCEKEHPMFVQRCPASGLHVEKVYRMTGDVVDGKYEVGPLIGMGGMGVVYEAKHSRIGRKVAIKFLGAHVMASQQAIVRFENEARVAASVGHRNIVNVLDLGETKDGIRYIVMEYLPGRDLGDILDASGRLPVDRSVEFTIQILSALRAVHEQGIIHRDLKPENIRVTGTQGNPLEVKIVDFGVSRLVGPAGSDLGITRTGTVIGTPRFMAPEQARGKKDIDRRVDLYSAGVILYRMLTGALPFDGENYNEVLIAITTREPADVRSHGVDLPEGLADAVMKAISHDPADRFGSADEFFAAVRPYRKWSDGQVERPAERMDAVKPVPMLDWSVVTGITSVPKASVKHAKHAARPGQYSISRFDNPTGMTDVVPGKLRLATPYAGQDRQEKASRPAEIADMVAVLEQSAPSVAWREPGAPSSKHDHIKTPTGEYARRSALGEAISTSARSSQTIGKPCGAIAVPKEIAVDHQELAAVRDSASIEGWVEHTSEPPVAPRARRRRRWLMPVAAACALITAVAGATAIVAPRLMGKDRTDQPKVSAADAGPAGTPAVVEAPGGVAGGMGSKTAGWMVDLGSLPEGATVWVDGVLHPERPVVVETGRASLLFRIEADGREAWERKVAIAADTALEVVMEKVSGAETAGAAATMVSATGEAGAPPANQGQDKGSNSKKGKKKTRIDTEYPGK